MTAIPGTEPAELDDLDEHSDSGKGPAEPGDRPRESLREWFRRASEEYGPALALFGLLKLTGFTVFMWLLTWSGEYLTKNPRFGGGARPWDVVAGWDGWWYRHVAENGYDPRLVVIGPPPFMYEQNSVAFFPLYPGMMKLVSGVTGLGSYGAGMLVSVVASFVAAAGIYALAARLFDRRTGLIAAAVWAVFPGSGVEWAVYSDSLFVALAAWSCFFVLERRWLAAGVTVFMAGLNRPTAAALVAALGVAALIALYRRRDGWIGPVSAVLIAPLGIFGYLAWANWRMGDWSAYFKLQKGGWLHFFDYGEHTFNVLRTILLGRGGYAFTYPTEDMIALGLVVLLPILLFLLIRLRVPVFLLVFTLITVVLVLGSAQIFGNTSRYLLPCFPLFLPIAVALRRLSLSSLVAVFGVTAVASGWYAGYVLFELGIP
ncbi:MULTISPECIES: glycosyltransferase family 39 protein [unclassified Kitasatospora]|uniref:glycosyltransferase family 39 protein n=1 Tax=unclassified Kitasatospora TaxID=2633591 RepID=UPI000A5A48A9|nr:MULTISPECIES: glycosyltransferase family 39 protein [unclassified Kitasatospora]